MEERGHLEQRGSKGRKMSKQQRRSFDAKFKLMAIKAAEATNNCQAAKKYGVTEGHVRKWRVQKERLKNANTMRKAFRGPKSGRFREIERRVKEYVTEKRKEGIPISRAMIQLKARELANEFKIPPTEFKASLGWCKRMIRRSGLVLRRRRSRAPGLPSDFKEKLLSCQRYAHELRKKHNYPLDQMGYAGQTPLYFDMPSSVTVEKKGQVLVKSTANEKNRIITVMLTCLADGTKLAPYVVLRGKTIPEEPTPPGIIVRAQEMGWMGTELMVDWLKAVWSRRRGWLRKKRNMLLLDGFHRPLTEPVEKQLRSVNGDLVIIPGGATNQLEVLDVVVNKPFRDSLHKKYAEWLPSADQAPTPTGGIQQPAVPLLCEWVLQAWDAVSSESIINGFKKFCTPNAMDGSEDDVLLEEAGPVEQPEDDWSDGSQDDAGPTEQPEDDWSDGSQDDVLLEEAGPAEQPEYDWSDGSQDDVLLEEAGPAEQPEYDWSDGSQDDVLLEEAGPAEQREEDSSDESDSEPSEAEDPSKFNRGVPADMKKQTWAEITARVNEIGECQREVMEVIKKWSDLKCDTKRKVAAMQAGTVPNRGLNSRLSRDLNPTEKIVLQILEMGAEDQNSDDFGPLGDDDDVPEEEEMEDEDMMKMQSSPSNGGLETESMPLPSSSHMSGNTQTGDTPQPSSDGQEEAVPSEEMEPVFPDSDEDGQDDDLPSTQTTKPAEDHQANNSVQKEAPPPPPPPPPPAALPPALPPPPPPEALPGAGPAPQSSRDSMLQNASLSLQEQHATNLLLETVSRSLELLSESVQQLAETQQEFVRESLQLQRETVQVLRDFTGGAIALMHDKLNGRPAL